MLTPKGKQIIAYREYCKSRNKVKKLMKMARKTFEMKTAKEIKSNPKAAWKYIKSKYKVKEGVQHLYTNPKDTKSKMTQTETEKAEVLASFFTSVFVIEDSGATPKMKKKQIETPIGDLVITPEKVGKIIQGLNDRREVARTR